jgi:hypothetical protein
MYTDMTNHCLFNDWAPSRFTSISGYSISHLCAGLITALHILESLGSKDCCGPISGEPCCTPRDLSQQVHLFLLRLAKYKNRER